MWFTKKKPLIKITTIHDSGKRVKLKATPRWDRTEDIQGHTPKFNIRCFHCDIPMALRHSVLPDPATNSALDEDNDANLMSYKCPRCAWFIRFNVIDKKRYLKKVIKEYRGGYRKFVPTCDDWSDESEEIKKQLDFYLKLREEIQKASGETLDLKTYEADMRHLIDNYVQADEPQVISPFGEQSLIDIIVKTGIADAINSLPDGIKKNQEAVAETIENNVRSKIIKDHLIDPAFFEDMSKLLAGIIKERKSNAINYEEYLKQIAELAQKVKEGKTETTPDILNTPAKRALYNNLGKDKKLAIAVHETIIKYRPDGWRGNEAKERVIKNWLYKILNDEVEVERIFAIVKKQYEY